jgi:hypothetical protein
VVLILAIQWLKLAWWQLSIFSLVYCGLWLVLTRLAKKEYLSVFRRSIETMSLEPERLTREAGDAATLKLSSRSSARTTSGSFVPSSSWSSSRRRTSSLRSSCTIDPRVRAARSRR